MNSHTSGPWFAIEYSGYWCVQSEEGYSDNNLLDIEKDPNAESNALLMASAPELLEALKSLLEAIPKQDNDHDWWPDELTHAVDKAKLLIEKQ